MMEDFRHLDGVLQGVRLRRRARRAFLWASVAAAPASALAAAAAVSLRLGAGGPAWAALALAAASLAAAWAAGFLRHEDIVRAAEELDRRAGLDALLATGLELRAGDRRDALAFAVAARAEEAARMLDAGLVPWGPPAWARYLTVPLAFAVAALTLPEGTSDARPASVRPPLASGTRPDETADATGDQAVASHTEASAREEARAAFAAYVADRRGTDRAAERPRTRVVRVAERAAPAEDGTAGDADADSARASSDEGAGGRGADSPGEVRGAHVIGGALDMEEAAVLTERFPEYEDILRRYFAGG